MSRTWTACIAALLLTAGASRGALTPEQIKALPPPAGGPVDFASQIKPIFEASCIRCHGRGRNRGGFQIDSRQSLLKGGDTGPGAVAGHSAGSYLTELVSGLNPDEVMPKKGKKLSAQEVGALRAWIDQGLPWPADISFGPVAPQNLVARLPKIPVGQHERNPVDRFLDVYFEQHHVVPPSPVDDRIFARRVYLDTIGLLPPPEELEAFVASHQSNKRSALVKRLLARKDAYAQNWLTFWNDLLRNDYRGTGYIDGGREQITKWLYSALLTNMPYDRFVAQLINPDKPAEGFSKGIVWRGVVNASQTPQMQAAQNVSQVFMGVNLKCASCHDSFVNDWQLSDAYGLANVFSDQPLEIYRCDLPTGQKAATKFLFPQLGDLPATTNKQVRLRALAAVITNPKDGRLSRTIVNRLWARFLGRGLVEPVDDMQQTAWDPDVLDWLAEDLVAHHYDVKHTMERIMTSRAYQMPAVDAGERQETNFVFTGPNVRRMTAEQFRDALASVTGVGYAAPEARVETSALVKKEFGAKLKAEWIWDRPNAAHDAKSGNIYLRKTIRLHTLPSQAEALVYCDNSFELYVNGHKAGSGADSAKAFMVDLKPWLKAGDNWIAVLATNTVVEQPAGSTNAPAPNPAGFYVYARVRAVARGRERVMDFSSDRSWVVTENESAGWEQPAFDAQGWGPASELGVTGIAPWKLPVDVVARQFVCRARGGVRASLVAADPLMVEMGRPNREQVVTTRAETATTLQALELTNGKTLAAILHRGADKLIRENTDGAELVFSVFQEAVGREPTLNEMALAQEWVGNKPTRAGVEDFLWAMAMLPEFQLVY
jgi:mono/diheme cytochrome c family protein